MLWTIQTISQDLFLTLECIYLAWKTFVFWKENIKTSFTHGVGKLASLRTLPPRKHSLRKPLALCKIACVSTVHADIPQTVIMHQAPIWKWTRVVHYYVHFHICPVKKILL